MRNFAATNVSFHSMEYHISSEMLCAAACLIYIFSGIFCGIVRWFHMCHPYDLKGDYFYPARKGVTISCLSLIVLLPYVLNVNDADAWLYARSFGIIYYPILTSWMILRYFKGNLRYTSFSKSIMVIVSVMLIALLLLATTTGYHLASDAYVPYIIGAWGCVLCAYLLKVVHWLKKKTDEYHHDNYSSEEDFPYRFARNVLLPPMGILILMWMVFLFDNREVKMWVDWIMVCYNIGFLCVILHPQRQLMADSQNEELERLEKEELDRMEQEIESENMEQENLDQDEEEPSVDCKKSINTISTNSKTSGSRNRSPLSQEQKEQFIQLIEHELRDNKAFLDSHYNLMKLSKAIGRGRTYTSFACTELGGFYYIINKYRLEYEELYSANHPDMDKEEIALLSGFTDKRAYRNALNI